MSQVFVYYAIRHRATSELMPQGKRNRGYSHWNPSNPNSKFEYALPTPRLLDTRRKAAHCINQWAINPNSKMSHSISYEGEEDYSVDTKPDGRKKEDLEVVEIELVVKDVE